MTQPLNARHHWTIARLAYWYLDRGRPHQAEKLTRGLLALNSGDGLAWKYYGEARRQQGDLEEAVEAFKKAARLLDDNAQIWMKLGTALLRLRRLEQARQALRNARKFSAGETTMTQRIDALLRRADG